MTIEVNNINDFISMIATCIENGIKDNRIFISENECYPSVCFPNTPKNHIGFKYILFTPLYTAIYSDSIPNEDYDKINKILMDYQEQCNHDFYIQRFDKISYNSNNQTLQISKELNAI